MATPTEFARQDDRCAAPVSPREDNKLRIEDRGAHDWCRFVLSFPAHLVQSYVKRFGLRSTHVVLDPFCGTGTTLVECKKLGIQSCGIEPNPMALFASRTKVDWSVDPEGLLAHATHVGALANEKLARQGIQDDEVLPLFHRPKGLPRELESTCAALKP